MLKRIRRFWAKNSSEGQNMTEYILLFVGVITVLIIALGPSGALTRKIDRTFLKAIKGMKCLVLNYCFVPVGEPGCIPVCPNECCERIQGEGDECIDCCRPRTICEVDECGIVSDGCVGTLDCGPCI